MAEREIVFLVNLLQDVNILRGLVFLARRETDAPLRLLVSAGFRRRDASGVWGQEIGALAAASGAAVEDFDGPAALRARLDAGAAEGGLMIAASESQLNAHAETRDAFRIAPPGYLKITLQHGLECVGFLQSREHVIGHGRDIVFNADVVCAWLEPARLTSLTVSQRAKLYVAGPPTLLQRPGRHPDHPPQDGGMVCENLHSVRLQATGDHKASFMDIFFAFCDRLGADGRAVTLRPHPGGQYVVKNRVALPDNVRLNNLPIYHVNLPGYAWGISAPSTIVLDMVLAGIPVGVWRDPAGIMDAGNYGGLTEISTLEDWLGFERDARLRPATLLARQRRFVERLGMVVDPAEIYRRYARLLVNGLALAAPPAPRTAAPADAPALAPGPPTPAPAPAAAVPARARARRVLFIANARIPTLQLSFLKPLAGDFDSGAIVHEVLCETELTDRFGAARRDAEAGDWFIAQIAGFAPDLIVCCRYSGPHPRRILRYGSEHGVPVVFHVDDDLLNIPPEIGEEKYRAHNNPARLTTVRTLLDDATLVYCSTPALKRRFRDLGVTAPILAGEVYCTSPLYRPARRGPVRKVGYMGFDHAHDFQAAVPALETYLETNPEVRFELFGSIPMPASFARFGARVATLPPVRDYRAFRRELADRGWDIGICPLAYTPFNAVKANTKWVEYTASGMAVIASAGLVYDACAGQGRGLLVRPDEWLAALQVLTDDPEARYRMVVRAQTHLILHYSDLSLRRQILGVFDRAAALAAARARDGVAAPA